MVAKEVAALVKGKGSAQMPQARPLGKGRGKRRAAADLQGRGVVAALRPLGKKTPRATHVANIARDTLVAEAAGSFAEARGSKAFLAEARGRLAEETRKVYVKKTIAVNRRANRVF